MSKQNKRNQAESKAETPAQKQPQSGAEQQPQGWDKAETDTPQPEQQPQQQQSGGDDAQPEAEQQQPQTDAQPQSGGEQSGADAERGLWGMPTLTADRAHRMRIGLSAPRYVERKSGKQDWVRNQPSGREAFTIGTDGGRVWIDRANVTIGNVPDDAPPMPDEDRTPADMLRDDGALVRLEIDPAEWGCSDPERLRALLFGVLSGAGLGIVTHESVQAERERKARQSQRALIKEHEPRLRLALQHFRDPASLALALGACQDSPLTGERGLWSYFATASAAGLVATDTLRGEWAETRAYLRDKAGAVQATIGDFAKARGLAKLDPAQIHALMVATVDGLADYLPGLGAEAETPAQPETAQPETASAGA